VWKAKCIVDNSLGDVQVSDMAARVLGYVQQGYIVRARTDIDTIVRLRSNTRPCDWQGCCPGTMMAGHTLRASSMCCAWVQFVSGYTEFPLHITH